MLIGILSKTWWSSKSKGGEESEAAPSSEFAGEGVNSPETLEQPVVESGFQPTEVNPADYRPASHSHRDRDRHGSDARGEFDAASDSVEASPSDTSPADDAERAEGNEQRDGDEPAPREGRGGRDQRSHRGRGDRDSRRRGNWERDRRPPADDIDEDDDSDDEETFQSGGAEDGPVREDPLAPAYDLEITRAPRQREARGGHQPFKSRITSAKEFFTTEILYRFDVLEREERAKVLGSYRVELKGNKGGVWTMQVGDDLNIVNRRDDADLVFTMQHRDFIALVNGDINPQLSLLAQKVRVTGEHRRAVSALALFAPPVD